VSDAQRAAAILLRATLWTGAGLVVVAGAVDVLGGGWVSVGLWVARIGIGVVIAGPFLTLVAIAVAARRVSVAVYAAVTIAVALLGAVLAR
jgi:hypothetical protein